METISQNTSEITETSTTSSAANGHRKRGRHAKTEEPRVPLTISVTESFAKRLRTAATMASTSPGEYLERFDGAVRKDLKRLLVALARRVGV